MAERASNRHAELDAKSINSAFRIPNSEFRISFLSL